MQITENGESVATEIIGGSITSQGLGEADISYTLPRGDKTLRGKRRGG